MGIDINLLSPVYRRTLFIEKNAVCNGSKTGIIDAVHYRPGFEDLRFTKFPRANLQTT
jgi:hypothetical protein